MTYRITAQHMLSSRRIHTIVRARSEAEAVRSVAAELDAACYYVVHVAYCA